MCGRVPGGPAGNAGGWVSWSDLVEHAVPHKQAGEIMTIRGNRRTGPGTGRCVAAATAIVVAAVPTVGAAAQVSGTAGGRSLADGYGTNACSVTHGSDPWCADK